MKIIKPTKREVFRAMKADGCTWCGGCGCECTARINMRTCFKITEHQLTRKEYTAEEIEAIKKQPNEADEAFNEFWQYVNS